MPKYQVERKDEPPTKVVAKGWEVDETGALIFYDWQHPDYQWNCAGFAKGQWIHVRYTEDDI